MALSSSALSALMRANMLADPDIGAVDDVGLTAMCDALASAVIAHITAAAVVTVPPGVAVVVAFPAGTGATTAPGVGAIT
jgi:hypothetical protein